MPQGYNGFKQKLSKWQSSSLLYAAEKDSNSFSQITKSCSSPNLLPKISNLISPNDSLFDTSTYKIDTNLRYNIFSNYDANNRKPIFNYKNKRRRSDVGDLGKVMLPSENYKISMNTMKYDEIIEYNKQNYNQIQTSMKPPSPSIAENDNRNIQEEAAPTPLQSLTVGFTGNSSDTNPKETRSILESRIVNAYECKLREANEKIRKLEEMLLKREENIKSLKDKDKSMENEVKQLKAKLNQTNSTLSERIKYLESSHALELPRIRNEYEKKISSLINGMTPISQWDDADEERPFSNCVNYEIHMINKK